jgi:predicted nucleic acid-binding protein
MAAATSLVDTNVLSELTRPRPNAGVLAWASETHTVSISVVTVEEVLFGLGRRPLPKVRRWWDAFVARKCQVLDVTPAIAASAGTLRGQLAAAGKIRTQADLLIAATAAHHGLVLVTRNVRDFAGCGVALLNPFT